ncbi:MAG TPA: VWA domain-containing protein [Gaiellales bacterium]|nr:VWA domain-containing protein [Gaiellales bacterium]
MTDAARPERAFGVETIELDLPPLVSAFCRRLHEAGMPVTPARAADLARALVLVRPIARRRLYWTARAVLVSDPADARAFDVVFREVFGDPRGAEPVAPGDPESAPAPAEDRPAGERAAGAGDPARDAPGAWSALASTSADEEDAAEVEMPLAVASDEERLAEKSFDALTPGELARLYELMSQVRLATPRRSTRRHVRDRHGRRVDMRRTLRRSLRTGGDPIRLARRRRRVVPRRLVMLCDISGSMEPYSRAYLQFLACAAGAGPNAEAFAFATRLTRLTRALASRRPERAMRRAAAAAPDWSSGTRIGDALKEFNDRHGRRGMARGAVIVILSDGWERGDPELVGREMARLARLAHRIVWVNPRMSASSFSVRAGGMVAALPYCDALVSGHSFAALAEVTRAIAGERSLPEPETEDEPEPWASATPAPGSSVAMPSGHGPSKGRTTPGWVTDG